MLPLNLTSIAQCNYACTVSTKGRGFSLSTLFPCPNDQIECGRGKKRKEKCTQFLVQSTSGSEIARTGELVVPDSNLRRVRPMIIVKKVSFLCAPTLETCYRTAIEVLHNKLNVVVACETDCASLTRYCLEAHKHHKCYLSCPTR